MTLKFDENKIPYIDLENGYSIRLETDDLTEEEAEKAKRELRETPEVVESALKELRVLLQGTSSHILENNKHLSFTVSQDNVIVLISYHTTTTFVLFGHRIRHIKERT